MKKVSSESNYDFLKFYIDIIEQVMREKTIEFYHTYSVNSEMHNFKWEYEKDFSVNSGADAAWIMKLFLFFLILSTPINKPTIDIKLYPNPVDDQLYLSSNGVEIVEASSDIFGKLIKHLTISKKHYY